MKIFSFKSIRNRLTFWFLIIALAPLLTALVITYTQRTSVIEARTFDKLGAIRDLKVARLQDWLAERASDMHVISNNIELTDLENVFNKTSFNQNDDKVIENSNRIINRYLKNHSAYREIFIINPSNGRVMISTDNHLVGENQSANDYFTKPMQSRELSIKDIYYSENLSDYSMVYSHPIFCSKHTDEHIVGIIVAYIDLNNSLYKILAERVGLGATGETLIVNKDVMALNELRWYDNAPLNLHISAEPAVKSSQGETGIAVTTDYRGEQIIAAYTYIPETAWGFVCKQDFYELNAPIRLMFYNFIILFIVSTIIIYLLALLIGRSLSKPIIDMAKLARNIQSGDFSSRVVIESGDEQGFLAASINKMIDSIESKDKIKSGISDISTMMIRHSSIKTFGISLLKQLMEITDSNMSVFYILNETASVYEHFASIGANGDMLKSFSSDHPEGDFGNAISKQSIYYLENIPDDTIFKFQTTAGDAIPKEMITIPIIVDNTVVALISLISIHPFKAEIMDILKQSVIVINTSYSSLLANERTRVLGESLLRTNQRLDAQNEELQEQSEELQNQAEEYLAQNIELEAQQKQVEEANRLKSEFLSNMSHELRTPLNSILALSRVVIDQARGKISEEQTHYLEIVERNGKQLLQLINDILDLSKIEAGFIDLHPKAFPITGIIEVIIESLSPLAKNKKIILEADLAEDLPLLESDEIKTHQILMNIIGNAVKFTDKGSVIVSVSYDENQIMIATRDTGIGIANNKLSSIFQEFHQIDSSSSRSYEGTGLGLAIAHKSARILGGDITVESKLGKGSAFSLILPLKWSDPQLLTESLTEAIPISQEEVVSVVPSDQRILLVDDNEAVIIQISSILNNVGYKVDVAQRGKEAIDYLQHTKPDGIILDLMMPDMDGFEVLAQIRNQNMTAKIPILVMTAKDVTAKDLKILKSNNIQQLIQKGNVDKNQLLIKIRSMLENEPALKKKASLQQRGKKTQSGIQTVLIVEDNQDNLTSLKAILDGKYRLLEARDGEQGIKATFEHLPDLVIMDMMLPRMDGFEVVKRIKADETTKGIPVIALTSKAMKGDRENILAAGCDDYLARPVGQEIILNKLEEWLG